MTTLLVGFIGLVIVPAFILAAALRKLVKEPAKNPSKEEPWRLFK